MNPNFLCLFDPNEEGNKRQLKGYLIGMGSTLVVSVIPALNFAVETYNSTKSTAQAVYSGLVAVAVCSQVGGLFGAILGDVLLKEKPETREAGS